MNRKDWQKVYPCNEDMLGIRVSNVLSAISEEPERRMSMKRMMAFALVAALALVSVTALAAGLLFADRVDVMQLADTALYEKYGITQAMQTYFTRNAHENEDGSTVVTYTGFADFAYVLGVYTVTVEGGRAEAVWSRDGEDTSGGFASAAWGAQQLEEALAINRETNSFGEVYILAMEHAKEAGMAAYEAPAMADSLAPEGYQSWEHYYRTRALPVMAIAPKDALAIAKDAIVLHYGLKSEQAQAMQWHDTWTNFAMVGDVPVLYVWFSLTLEESAWSEGDGLYGAAVNVETGVIEEIVYDSALAGNG